MPVPARQVPIWVLQAAEKSIWPWWLFLWVIRWRRAWLTSYAPRG